MDRQTRKDRQAVKAGNTERGGNYVENGGAGRFTIQNPAERSGISVKTLKKWEQEEKIPQARRSPFGWRVCTEQELDMVENVVKDNGFFVKSNSNDKAKKKQS